MPERIKARDDRPRKPYPEFPLFPHRNGCWAKKIRGRFVFFGPWADAEGALGRYLEQRDQLHAGLVPRSAGVSAPVATRSATLAHVATGGAGASRTPVSKTAALSVAPGNVGESPEGLTTRDLINHFLSAKKRRMDSGEMGRRSFNDYHLISGRVIKVFGAHRLAEDVQPSDFGVLRAELAKTLGPIALANAIGRVRSIYKYGYDTGLMSNPVRFGPEFAKPNKRSMRLVRQARGERMFEAAEIHTLLRDAGAQMKAMILLGVNAGMGNTDVAGLPKSALDLKSGMLAYPRQKTGIPRRAALWPETVAALKDAMKVRPKPKDREHAELVFITKYGSPWVRVSEPKEGSKSKRQAVITDAVVLEFGKLVRETKTHKTGRGFYALRHTFRTIADAVGDRPAIDLIMGHQDGQDISVHYVERLDDERLKKVSEHVRAWLFAPQTAVTPASRPRRKTR